MSSQSTLLTSLPRERGIWSVIDPLERAVSLLLLILLAPVLLLTGMAIVVLSGRSPLVAHLRIGQFGAPFWTLKFRSMWSGRSRDRKDLLPEIHVVFSPWCEQALRLPRARSLPSGDHRGLTELSHRCCTVPVRCL